jgi:phage tail-like protein
MAAQRALMAAPAHMMEGIVQDALGIPLLPRELEDPMGGYVFALEIEGVELAHFQECSGLKSTTEIFEIKEGGANHAVHKLPGQSKWDNIVLRYGVSSDASMLALRDLIVNDDYSLISAAKFAAVQSSLGGLMAGMNAAVRSAMGSGSKSTQMKRFNGSIVIKNNRMQEMVRYTFKDAWTVSWEGPKFNAESSDLAVESIELAHHGIEVSRSWRASVPWGWT